MAAVCPCGKPCGFRFCTSPHRVENPRDLHSCDDSCPHPVNTRPTDPNKKRRVALRRPSADNCRRSQGPFGRHASSLALFTRCPAAETEHPTTCVMRHPVISGTRRVNDYTELGLSKIALQARRNMREIRCPRDGAVMRVVARVSVDQQNETSIQRHLALSSIDVECPACRRKAKGVSLATPSSGDANFGANEVNANVRPVSSVR